MRSGPTKLPESLRQAPKRYLRDVAVGETVFVSFTAMQADAEANCFLNPDAKIVNNPMLSIRVERQEDEYYITTYSGQRWDVGNTNVAGWFPVASIRQTDDMMLGERYRRSE